MSTTLVPLAHHEAPAPLIVEIELGDCRGHGPLLVGRLYVTEIMGAVAQDGDAPWLKLGARAIVTRKPQREFNSRAASLLP
jgi:hypothetical protein